jgi:hypothetical protein
MPGFQVYAGLGLVGLGIGAIVYGVTMKTTEDSTKPRTAIHWVVVVIGALVAIIGVLMVVFYYVGQKGVCKPTKGFKCISVEESEVPLVQYSLKMAKQERQAASSSRLNSVKQAWLNAQAAQLPQNSQ